MSHQANDPVYEEIEDYLAANGRTIGDVMADELGHYFMVEEEDPDRGHLFRKHYLPEIYSEFLSIK